MSNQVAREVVTLESIGPVEVSEIFMVVDSYGAHATGRPNGGYFEIAVLWGEEDKYGLSHCYIVDSNLVDREPADALFQKLTDSTELAKLMHHVLTHPNIWDA